ncbi:MAG TPA: serine O-acetyltransferase [Steroidobacteraceae bacterium]|jgi:serine O-acetyltransferase|nr:serine O-acetyltransferase [Steroidobacteraceae bacterium]
MKAVAYPPSSNPALDELTGEFLDSYMGDERARRISRRYLPSREAIVEILESILDLMYPGYFGRRDLSSENLGAHVAHSMATLAPKLESEMEHCLCYGREQAGREPEGARPEFGECAPRAHELAEIFLSRLPQIRGLLIRDVQAAFDGDPAATNLDEVILAYPGVLAVSVYRIAHALYDLGVPMMARIMTEWAHSKTGADIHPGAKIGPAFFIDHATGVVIGETTDIGEGVKLYQGVTLGALSFPRDSSGQIIRGKKRHPTVENGSTLYANATVLGGQTVVGAESVIGGSVFLTRSVPPRSRVSLKEPDLRVATREGAAEPDAIYFDI